MKIKMTKLAKLVGAAAIAAGASSAQAAVNLPFPVGDFQLSDNSGEYLINCDPADAGCQSTAGDTTLDIGDRLHGIFYIQDISSVGIEAGSGYDELAGVFDVTVTNITNIGGLNPWLYEFGVTSSFAADYGLSADAAVAWYTDPNHEFTREAAGAPTVSSLEALITDGTLLWGSGFGGDAFWYATTSTTDTAAIAGAPGNTGAGQFVFGLNLTDNFSNLLFNPVDCYNGVATSVVQVDQCANGNIYTPAPSSGNTTPFDIWDDVNFTMNRVPVPAPVALLGVGLLALIPGLRKAKKA